MYYILIETEQVLVAWIDEMEVEEGETTISSNSTSSRSPAPQGVLSATKQSEPEASSSGATSEVVLEQEVAALKRSGGNNSTLISSRSSAPDSLPRRSTTDEEEASSDELPLEEPLDSESAALRRSSGNGGKACQEDEVVAIASSSKAPEKKRSTYNVLEAMAGPSTPLPTIKKKLAFTSGNPSVETVQGIIHIYNEHPAMTSVSGAKRSRMVCIVAVPTWLSVADLMDFFQEEGEHLAQMEGIRVLADSSPNKYMVVLKFYQPAGAVAFVRDYNGKAFSSMSEGETPEVCHCAYVKYVDFVKPTANKSKEESISSSTMFPYSALASPSLVEVPTCAVCLERLDASVSGLLTILCNHTFHCTCLMQWKEDNTCPVCRFTQQPAGHDSLCSKCGTHEGLWICLLCGHVGCSRYQDSHAYSHYKDTFHNYALELSSQRVWDYAGDGYVHRLIQNKTDGKLVELPAIHGATGDVRDEHAQDKDGLQKVDAIYLEYQYLLTAQLETQRSWFEQKMREHEEIRSRQLRELEQTQKTLREQLAKATARNKQLEAETSQQISAHFDKDKQIKDLEEQLRDVMLFLDARKAISANDELADGSVVYLANPDQKIAASSSSLPSTPAREALRRKLAKKGKK